MRLGVRPVGKAAESKAAEGTVAKSRAAQPARSPKPARVVVTRSTSLIAGRSFARLTILPLLIVIGWLLPGIPLLLVGRFLPVPMVLIAAPLAAILAIATLREVPARWPSSVRHLAHAPLLTAPVAYVPVLDMPAADPPVVDAPSADAAAADGPAADGPAADEAVDESAEQDTEVREAAEAPAAEAPAAEAPAVDVPAVDEPLFDEPVFDESVLDKSVLDKSVLDKSVLDKSVLDEPAADEPVVAAADVPAVDVPAVDVPAVDGRAAAAVTRTPARVRAWPAWWGLGGTLAVAVGFGAWQILLNSPQLIVLRSPGALTQFGYWIAQHGSLPIPSSLAAFGGAHPGLTFSSTGFAQQPSAVEPRFMVGLPMMLAAGFWVHGFTGAAFVNPILGAFAVLTFGGLAGRLAGPQWAPAAALVLALTLPEQYTSRSAFGEPLVQVLLFGGLCLLADSLIIGRSARHARAAGRRLDHWPEWLARWFGWLAPRPGWLVPSPGWLGPAPAAAAIGGFALGLTSLVLIGSLGVVVPSILFVGALVAGRRSQAVPCSGGLLIGAGCGLAAGYLLAPGYLRGLGNSLRDVGLIAAGLAVISVGGVAATRYEPSRRRVRRLLAMAPLRWLPEVAAALCVAVLIAFAVRPFVQTVRGNESSGAKAYVAALQRLLQLPTDPTRLYAEHSLYWVIWYIGLPAVLLGGFGIALLARRCLRALLTWQDSDAAARVWALPLMIIGWGAVSVLWRPDTVPDQPWASRRLVPVLLPGLILCAIWVSAWLAARARERGAGAGAVSAAAACFVVALAIPTALATFGFGLTFATVQHSARPAGGGLALNKVGSGQADTVSDVCGTLSASSTVVILDRVAASQFSQLIRGMCNVPTGVMVGATPTEVQAVLSGIAAAGRRPVLIGSGSAEFAQYGYSPSKILDLTTTQDAHELTQPPTAPWQIRYVLWESTPGSALTGA